MKGCVLVVDDDPNIRSLISVALKRSGFNAISAGDGATAMDLLREMACDLVVLDIMMPRMSGTQFLELMRADDRQPPAVILVTAASHIELGSAETLVDAVITKPFELSDLLDAVKRSLGRRNLPPEETELA